MTRRPAKFALSSLSASVLFSEHCPRLDSKQEMRSLILLQYKQECYQHPEEKKNIYRQNYMTNSGSDDNFNFISAEILRIIPGMFVEWR